MWNKIYRTKEMAYQEAEDKAQLEAEIRATKGAEMVYRGQVCHMGDFAYVQSDRDPSITYRVDENRCECRDFERRNAWCKHMFAYEFTKGQLQN